MKANHFSSCFTAFIIVLFASVFSRADTVTVTGTVVDSDGNPVGDAMVLLITDTSDIVNGIDTVFTAADGKIDTKITVDPGTAAIVYMVIKDGYTSKYGYGIIASGVLALGEIVLTQPGDNDTISVTGTVVDSVTGDPIENAQVIISSITVMKPDSILTDGSGKFICKVEISGDTTITEQVFYAVSKDGYQMKTGMQNTGQDPLDLGTILLQIPIDPIIHNPVFPITQIQPDRMEIYSINGQRLYAGPVLDLRSKRAGTIIRNQSVVVRYMQDTRVLGSRKIVAIH